jgi:predicted Zn-dependent peptidase
MGIRGLAGWVCAALAMAGSGCADYIKPVTLQVDLQAGTYVLANGMRVVLQHDADTPFVHARVTYGVGGGDETPDKTGLAHLAEHLTYRARAGSTTIHAYEQGITDGDMNGETSARRTSYHGSMRSSQLGRFLWAEARRMAFPLEGVTQTDFDTERSVVMQELGQNYANQPYGFASFAALGALFPAGHPDRHPTIGYIDHLKTETLSDVARFVGQYYGPDNATLVVSGNFDTNLVVRDVDRFFGPQLRKHRPERPAPPAVAPGPRLVKMVSGEPQAATLLAFPGPPEREDQWAAMVVLEYFLSSYTWWGFRDAKNLAHTELWPLRSSSVLFVRVVAAPGEELGTIDERVFDKMEEIVRDVRRSPSQLANARSSLLLEHMAALENLSARGERIARHMHDHDEPDRTQEELRALQAVTLDDLDAMVQRFRETYVAVHVEHKAGATRGGEMVVR